MAHTKAESRSQMKNKWQFLSNSPSSEDKAHVMRCEIDWFHFSVRSTSLSDLTDMPNHGRLMPTEERLPNRLRNGGRDKDIFALTKLRMSSDHLSQDPLLIYPEGFVPSTRHFRSRVADPNSALPLVCPKLDTDRCRELAQLEAQIAEDFPHMARACSYYKMLMDPTRETPSPSRFQFISLRPRADERIGEIELGNPGVQPKPHKLRVVFHRAANGG